MNFPSINELKHYYRVARNFYPWQEQFWLALSHDLIEDGYVGEWFSEKWPALKAITRNKSQKYHDYIKFSVALNKTATDVKIRDLFDNLSRRDSGIDKIRKASLTDRYLKALQELL